jgi:quinol monooxygenase YgiN
MVSVALLVRLEAKPGKQTEVAKFLQDGLAIVQAEPATTAWFAIKMGPSTFGIFDAFPGEAGRKAHLAGPGCGGPHGQAPGASQSAAELEQLDVLAAKLPT